MSYFGVSGPAQDGGFIAGIGAGANRLNTARAARASYSKSLAGRVSSGLAAASTSQPLKAELPYFLQIHSHLLTPVAITRLQIDAENDRIPEYYVDINDINGRQVAALIATEKETIRAEVTSQNPGQSQANIDVYVREQAKVTVRDQYLIPLFRDAGYEENDSNALGKSAINRTAGSTPITKRLRNAQYKFGYNPGPDEATAEYLVNQGIAQNPTQKVLYAMGIAVLGYYIVSRRRPAAQRGRTSAFYGVFS